MKPIRWTPHALQNFVDREIERLEADRTLLQGQAPSRVRSMVDGLAKGSARPKRFNEPPRGGHRVLLYCLVGDDGVVYSRLAKRGEPLLATGDWPHEKDLVYHAI